MLIRVAAQLIKDGYRRGNVNTDMPGEAGDAQELVKTLASWAQCNNTDLGGEIYTSRKFKCVYSKKRAGEIQMCAWFFWFGFFPRYISLVFMLQALGFPVQNHN